MSNSIKSLFYKKLHDMNHFGISETFYLFIWSRVVSRNS